MSLGSAIRITRQRAFCTQEDFARELDVAISTVNRWELNKARPSMKAMKALKEFCEGKNLSYKDIENEWLTSTEE